MIFQEKRTSVRNDPAFLLAIVYTIGFFGFSLLLQLKAVPSENKDMVSQLIPVLSMIQGGIVQYFYQRAKDAVAEKKDDAIKTLAQTAATTATTAAIAAGVPSSALPKPDSPSVAPLVPPTPNGTITTEHMTVNADTVDLNPSGEKKE